MTPERPPVLFKSPTITNPLAVDVLPQGSWLNKPAFIIGGGPSLAGFNFERLRGRRTIGVNLAFYFFEPTIIFSMDTRFLNWITNGTYETKYPGCREKFRATAAYKIWLLTYTASLPDSILVAPVFRNYDHGRLHLSWVFRDGLGHGNNSGFGALNLALVLGANPIYLLGFDMKHEKTKTHYHAGHPLPQSPSQVAGFIQPFDRSADEIKKRGIRVVNLNRGSALRSFEFGDIEEATK
jgi:hypothetical protein